MTIRTTKSSVSAEIDDVCVRLERMRRHGFFARPRNISNVWCHLTDEGHRVDLVILGFALYRLWEEGVLWRTLLVDGLLHYVDTTNAGHWRGIDMPAVERSGLMPRAPQPPIGPGA